MKNDKATELASNDQCHIISYFLSACPPGVIAVQFIYTLPYPGTMLFYREPSSVKLAFLPATRRRTC